MTSRIPKGGLAPRGDCYEAHVVTTGTVFALLILAHIWRVFVVFLVLLLTHPNFH